jgi:hypothetical protein
MASRLSETGTCEHGVDDEETGLALDAIRAREIHADAAITMNIEASMTPQVA